MEKEVRKIALFGGSFDPFTVAHRNIVEKASQLVDEIVIVPTIVDWHRPDKDKWLTAEQKIETIVTVMTYAKLREGTSWCYSRSELDLADFAAKNSFDEFEKDRFLANRGFYDTLIDEKKSKITYDYDGTSYEFYFIIGTDQYKSFKTWRNWQHILKHAKMIVVQGRNGEVVPDDDIPHETLTIDPEFADVSASKIREEWMQKDYQEFKDWTEYEYMIDWNREEVELNTPIFKVIKGAPRKVEFDPVKHKGAQKFRNCFSPVLIDAPDWVSVIVEKDGKFLVEKQFRYGANDYIEEFPCGMVEKDEDPLDAIQRELIEETGIHVIDKKSFVKLGQTNPNPAFMTNKMHYYYVCLDHCSWSMTSQKLDANEELEYYWKNKGKFMFDLADDAHACGKKQVPAIALSMVKLYENASNYPGCG